MEEEAKETLTVYRNLFGEIWEERFEMERESFMEVPAGDPLKISDTLFDGCFRE